jgi:hypothetical protein
MIDYKTTPVLKVDTKELYYLVINGGYIGPFESKERCSEEYRSINSQGIKILSARVVKEDKTFVFTIV